jgi:DNA-binding MarR family transcriptional regulator
MTRSSLSVHVDQVAEIVRDLVRLRSHLKVELSPDLAWAKAQLDELHSQSKTRGVVDHTLLLQVEVVLSRQQEPLTMGELSKALDVPLSTATRIANWWVKNGYAERSRDPSDRRIVRVALTKAGHALIKTSNTLVRQRVEQVLRHFTPDERETLVVLMRKLVESLENEEE